MKICPTILFIFLFIPLNAQDSLETLSKINNRIAPNFYLEGNFHFLNDYCGTKISRLKTNNKQIVLLSFFATWCLPCREEFKTLEAVSSIFSEDTLKIFLIDIQEPKDKVIKFANEFGIKIPILLDIYGVTKKRYNINSIPQTILIDQNQNIIFEHVGYNFGEPLFEGLRAKVDSLLAVMKIN